VNDEQIERLIDELIADGGEDLAGRRSNLKANQTAQADQIERLIDELISDGGEDLAGRRPELERREP
jgi:hypothetical protein